MLITKVELVEALITSLRIEPIIVGLVTFIWNLKYNPQEFGSKWCYAAVSMAVIMLMYPLIKN